MRKTEIDVVDDPERPVKKEVLSEAIVAMSAAMKKLSANGLNRKAIIVLVHDLIPAPSYGRHRISKGEIAQVFDALEQLKDRYTR